MRNRRRVVAAIAALSGILVSLSLGASEAVEAFPSKPIRIIVPYAAGGGTDTVARLYAPSLRKELGQGVAVENVTGGSGVIGTGSVARARPDGYTLLIATFAFPVTQHLIRDVPYDPLKDFQPIITGGTGPLGLVVPGDSPYNSLQALIEAARKKPNAFNFGSLGNGSQEQLGAVLLQQTTGITMTEVPYKGAAPAMVDLIAGRIHVLITGLPSVLPHTKAGRLKLLGVAGQRRSSLLSDVPTIQEAGVRGYEAYSWHGFLAPAGTPRPIVDKLNAAFNRVLQDPVIRTRLIETFGSEPAGGTPEDFASFIAARAREGERTIKSLGIKPQ